MNEESGSNGSGGASSPTISHRLAAGTFSGSLMFSANTSGSQIMSSAPDLRTMWSISAGRSMKFIGTGIAPIFAAAKLQKAISTRFAVIMATRSPRSTPTRRSACAIPFTSRRTSRKDRTSPVNPG